MHAGSYGVWTMVSSWHLDLCCHFFFFAPLHLGGTEGRRCTEEQHILNFARTTTPAGQYLTPNLHGVRRLPTKLSSPSLGPWGVSAARASQCRSKWKKLACIGFPSGGAKRSMSRVYVRVPVPVQGKRDLSLTWRRTLFFVCIALCRCGVWCGVDG